MCMFDILTYILIIYKDSWIYSLRTRFKQIRFKITTCDDINELKKKFGQKGN